MNAKIAFGIIVAIFAFKMDLSGEMICKLESLPLL